MTANTMTQHAIRAGLGQRNISPRTQAHVEAHLHRIKVRRMRVWGVFIGGNLAYLGMMWLLMAA